MARKQVRERIRGQSAEGLESYSFGVYSADNKLTKCFREGVTWSLPPSGKMNSLRLTGGKRRVCRQSGPWEAGPGLELLPDPPQELS